MYKMSTHLVLFSKVQAGTLDLSTSTTFKFLNPSRPQYSKKLFEIFVNSQVDKGSQKSAKHNFFFQLEIVKFSCF